MIQTYALRGRPVPAKNGLWVHVDDCTRLKLERAYAQYSLDAAKAEIARLTAERDAALTAFGTMNQFAVVVTEADGEFVSVKQRDYEALRAILSRAKDMEAGNG